MMKKISFGKLRQRFNIRKNKSEGKETNDLNDSKTPEEESDRYGSDVDYDKISIRTESKPRINCNSELNTIQKSNKSPIDLFQSFRNKFKKSSHKEKNGSELKAIENHDLDKSKTDLVLNNNENDFNKNIDGSKCSVSEQKSEHLIENMGQNERQTDNKFDLKSSQMTKSISSRPPLLQRLEEDMSYEEVFEESYDNNKDNANEKKFSLIDEIEKLVTYGWYWGPITRPEAEQKLENQMDGAFLVRDSSDDHYLFSLSFRSFGRTLHTRIECRNGLFSFYSNNTLEGNKSLVGLIEESMTNSENGVFCYSRGRSGVLPSFPVRLTKPVSRFTEVRSLQYLCKFVIRQSTNYNQIQSLPLPKTIKGYIENGRC